MPRAWLIPWGAAMKRRKATASSWSGGLLVAMVATSPLSLTLPSALLMPSRSVVGMARSHELIGGGICRRFSRLVHPSFEASVPFLCAINSFVHMDL